MATAKKKIDPTKITLGQAKIKIAELEEKLAKFESYGYCYMCDTHKAKDKFYLSTDPMIKSQITPICKECARKIALRVDKNGDEHEPTKESVQTALRYLNKPYLNTVWDASVQESENLTAGKLKTNAYQSYVKNIAMVQYIGKTYFDGDNMKSKIVYDDEKPSDDEVALNRMSADSIADYEKNKKDVTRLLGYDPFELEAVSDQPFLYSQLLGLMDAGGDENDDMLRNSSCISIVRGFLQAHKIDNSITTLMSDSKHVEQNSATIKSLQESKQKIMSTITSLAAESCISLKNTKSAKKGENTWTGKIKKIKDMALREGEVNGFDIMTCRGMQQVREISDASIMKQLALDDSDWSDMVAQMRETIVKLREEKDAYQEINRILLRENLDLKDEMSDKDIEIKTNLKDLNDLYSVFGDNLPEDKEEQSEESEDE